MAEMLIGDMPSVGKYEAARLLNMGVVRFKTTFKKRLCKHIRSFIRPDGTIRYLLIDIVKAAYPGASEATQYQIAYLHTIRLARDRKQSSIRREKSIARGSKS